jgi:hypothetical protein
MEKRKFTRCFISAPVDVSISPIMSLLKSKGISVSDFYSLGVTSDSTSVESEISKADFVIAILSYGSSQNVFYEIGLAKGLKKPIFLIVADESYVPYFLKENVYVKTDLIDSEILSYRLNQFLLEQKKLPKESVKTPTVGKKRQPSQNKEYFAELRSQLTSLETECNGIKFSNLLEDILRHQGFVVESSQGPDVRADMSIWIDSLEKTLGNPILIETKCGELSESRLDQSEMQLREILKRSNLRSGILIYLDRNGRRFESSKFAVPLIIRFEIFDLIKRLSEETLDCVLLKERNKIAHGGFID